MSLNCGGSLLGARYDTGLELVLLQGARYAAVIFHGSNVWASSGPSLDGSIVLKYTSGSGTSPIKDWFFHLGTMHGQHVQYMIQFRMS